MKWQRFHHLHASECDLRDTSCQYNDKINISMVRGWYERRFTFSVLLNVIEEGREKYGHSDQSYIDGRNI